MQKTKPPKKPSIQAIITPTLDPATLAETERLLAQPLPLELQGIKPYDGPNAPGAVNGLIEAARRIARGAIDDGLFMARAVVDGAEAKRRG